MDLCYNIEQDFILLNITRQEENWKMCYNFEAILNNFNDQDDTIKKRILTYLENTKPTIDKILKNWPRISKPEVTAALLNVGEMTVYDSPYIIYHVLEL